VRDCGKLALLGEHFGNNSVHTQQSFTLRESDDEDGEGGDEHLVSNQPQTANAHLRRKRKVNDAEWVESEEEEMEESAGKMSDSFEVEDYLDTGEEEKDQSSKSSKRIKIDGTKVNETEASTTTTTTTTNGTVTGDANSLVSPPPMKALPFDFTTSPNGTSVCIMYNDCRCEVVLLTSLYLPAPIGPYHFTKSKSLESYRPLCV